jgi:hypothetical protein
MAGFAVRDIVEEAEAAIALGLLGFALDDRRGGIGRA